MELEKNHFRSTSVWASNFRSINSTEFNVEHENTCPFPCHLGSSINNISGQVLTCNCAKKNYLIIFCIKFTIYKKIQNFQKNSYKNIFFIFLLYDT